MVLQLLQCVPIKPSWHPRGHTPLTWSHGSLFIQCPLHFRLQSIPKYPTKHSVQKRSHRSVTNLIQQYYQNKSFIICIKDRLMMQLNYQTENILTCTCIYTLIDKCTFGTFTVSISRFTSSVTMSSLFVTWRVIQTVTITGVNTVISIGPVFTFC